MTNLQKWLLVFAAITLSFATSFYLFVYIPSERKMQVQKQAFTECEKRKNDSLNTLNEGLYSREAAENAGRIFNQMWPSGSIEQCISKLLKDWGYKQ